MFCGMFWRLCFFVSLEEVLVLFYSLCVEFEDILVFSGDYIFLYIWLSDIEIFYIYKKYCMECWKMCFFINEICVIDEDICVG